MQIYRAISERVKSLAKGFPVVAVTGARQVGKTTLLKSLFNEHRYVSLDLPSVAELAENNPELFLQQYPAPLIVDEVQYAPKLFRALKIIVDKNRHKMGSYILTGSQKFSLMKEVTESLAGRVGLLELECLSLAEIGEYHDWASLMARGFYPELWRQPTLSSQDFYTSYVATYLERDVRQILNISSLRDFERFIRALAVRSGQLLNRSDLARDVGVSSKTAGEWISVLQASNQIYLLEPYFENIGKRLIKSPKVYFHDSGLLCFLLGLDESSVAQSPLIGSVWETFVYAEMRKRLVVQPHSSSIWYYQAPQGKELDFLILRRGELNLFETKWSEQPDLKAFKSLQLAYQDLIKSKSYRIGTQFIVCRTQNQYAKNEVKIINPSLLFY